MNVLGAVVALTSSLVISIAAFAQDATLLPEAQKAFDRGNSAVQQQQWGQAVRYFTDAHKIGGNDPRILLNLGLAQARAGNELHAIAWLNAAAAAMPEAPNVPAIRQEAQKLKEQVLAKIDRLVGHTIAAAENMPEKMVVRLQGEKRDSVLDNFARMSFFEAAGKVYAKFGDDQRAFALLQRGSSRASHDDLRSLRVRALSDADDFDKALSIAEAMAPGAVRNKTLTDIIEHLLSDRHHAGKVAADDIAQARRFLSLITDADRRNEAERRFIRLKLRERFEAELNKGRFDASAFEELLSASNEYGRPHLFKQAAYFHADKADFESARRITERMGEFNPSATGDALAYIALMQIKAGRRSDAADTARRLAKHVEAHRNGFLAYSVRPLEAVAKAVLGDLKGASQIAARGDNPPIQVYIGSPDYIGYYDPGFGTFIHRQSQFGAIVFCAVLTGRIDDAIRIARQDTALPNLQNFAMTNIAYTLLKQSNLTKAIETIKAVPVRNDWASDHGRAQILGLILIEQIKRGDLKAAEQTVHQITGFAGNWRHGARYRTEGLLRIARVYHGKGQAGQAMRLVVETKKMIRDAVADPAIQREGLGEVDELRELIAMAQVDFGDAAGAASTRTEKTRFASDGVKAWVKFVTSQRMNYPQMLEPEKHTLEEIRKPAKEGPSPTTAVELIAEHLRRIEVMEVQIQ